MEHMRRTQNVYTNFRISALLPQTDLPQKTQSSAQSKD